MPLQGAEFTLYTNYDEETGNVSGQYTNAYHVANEPTATSDEAGKINIKGLAAGTYYLKETEAPSEFSLNNTVYKIQIKPEFDGEELVSWDVIVEPMDEDEETSAVTSGFTVSGGTATADTGNTTTDIMNTTISFLPSTGGIGTTIFTIGGCVIMVTAAGLYFATRKKEHNA